MHKLAPLAAILLALATYFYLQGGFDPGSIRGKRVLVTGASSGIGEQLAYEYSRLGARVFITARRKNLLEGVAKKCGEVGALQVEFVTSDLGVQEDRDNVMNEVKKRFGGLDHLILNHAIASPGLWLGTKENMTKFLAEMNVNLLSFVDLTSQATPMLIESQGHLGVVSSVAGKFASAGVSAYSAAKHAMQGFFSALRQEWRLRRTGISVTTCVIGPVDTLGVAAVDGLNDHFAGLRIVASSRDTAVAIMRGVACRRTEIYHGWIAWVVVNLHKIVPNYLEGLSGRLCLDMHNITV